MTAQPVITPTSCPLCGHPLHDDEDCLAAVWRDGEPEHCGCETCLLCGGAGVLDVVAGYPSECARCSGTGLREVEP